MNNVIGNILISNTVEFDKITIIIETKDVSKLILKSDVNEAVSTCVFCGSNELLKELNNKFICDKCIDNLA